MDITTEFRLIMSNVVVDDKLVDHISIEWTETMPSARLLAISARWAHSTKFITQRMKGLSMVGVSTLEFAPIDYDAHMEGDV